MEVDQVTFLLTPLDLSANPGVEGPHSRLVTGTPGRPTGPLGKSVQSGTPRDTRVTPNLTLVRGPVQGFSSQTGPYLDGHLFPRDDPTVASITVSETYFTGLTKLWKNHTENKTPK